MKKENEIAMMEIVPPEAEDREKRFRFRQASRTPHNLELGESPEEMAGPYDQHNSLFMIDIQPVVGEG